MVCVVVARSAGAGKRTEDAGRREDGLNGRRKALSARLNLGYQQPPRGLGRRAEGTREKHTSPGAGRLSECLEDSVTERYLAAVEGDANAEKAERLGSRRDTLPAKDAYYVCGYRKRRRR